MNPVIREALKTIQEIKQELERLRAEIKEKKNKK